MNNFFVCFIITESLKKHEYICQYWVEIEWLKVQVVFLKDSKVQGVYAVLEVIIL